MKCRDFIIYTFFWRCWRELDWSSVSNRTALPGRERAERMLLQ